MGRPSRPHAPPKFPSHERRDQTDLFPIIENPQLARIRILEAVPRTRRDSEGVELIDLEAQSAKRTAPVRPRGGAARLSLWRRAQAQPAVPTRDPASLCPQCGVPASVRQLWAECPTFQGPRRRISLEYGIPEAWWGCQPHVTRKSGWITVGAGPTAETRSSRQVAAAKLAFVTMRARGQQPPDCAVAVPAAAGVRSRRRATAASSTARRTTMSRQASCGSWACACKASTGTAAGTQATCSRRALPCACSARWAHDLVPLDAQPAPSCSYQKQQ